MRRVRSTLNEGGFPILAVAAVNLILILCVCLLLPNHLGPRYGYGVQADVRDPRYRCDGNGAVRR